MKEKRGKENDEEEGGGRREKEKGEKEKGGMKEGEKEGGRLLTHQDM